MRSLIRALVALLVVASVAGAQVPTGKQGRGYFSLINGNGAAATTVLYFNQTDVGGTLTADASKGITVYNVSFVNATGGAINVRVYTPVSPSYDGAWSATYADDYQVIAVPSYTGVGAVTITGLPIWAISFPVSPSGNFYALGWNEVSR